MILDNYINIQLNPRNVKHFEELGYSIPYVIKNNKRIVPRNTFIKIKPQDLNDGSHTRINVQCDNPNCSEHKYIEYRLYKSIIDKFGNYLCRACSHEHQKETLLKEYGVVNVSQIEFVKKKKEDTLLTNYGVDNPMKSREIQAKAKTTNLDKYGVESPSQNPEIQKKIKNTLQDRYGCTSVQDIPGVKEKRVETNIERYGVPHVFQNKEIYKKFEETMLSRYGSKQTMNVPELAERQRQSCFEHYGVYIPAQNPEVVKKMRETMFKNGTAPTSNQQLYLCQLFSGQLNHPLGCYSLDIFIDRDNTVIEYDGGGHDLSVKCGMITEDEFRKKEIIRSKYIIKAGIKLIKIITTNDLLPSDEILLQMYRFAEDYFNSTDHTWIEFYPEKNVYRNAEHMDKDGAFFNYGELRKISKGDTCREEVAR